MPKIFSGTLQIVLQEIEIKSPYSLIMSHTEIRPYNEICHRGSNALW